MGINDENLYKLGLSKGINDENLYKLGLSRGIDDENLYKLGLSIIYVRIKGYQNIIIGRAGN